MSPISCLSLEEFEFWRCETVVNIKTRLIDFFCKSELAAAPLRVIVVYVVDAKVKGQLNLKDSLNEASPLFRHSVRVNECIGN